MTALRKFLHCYVFQQAAEINGEVDATNINMVFLGANRNQEPGAKVGGKYTADLINEESILYYSKKPNRQICFFDTYKKLETKPLVHAVQVNNEMTSVIA